MGNQFAGSQSGQQIADCRLGGHPSSVLDVDDSLLVPVGDPGERHPERPMCVVDSLLHDLFYSRFRRRLDAAVSCRPFCVDIPRKTLVVISLEELS